MVLDEGRELTDSIAINLCKEVGSDGVLEPLAAKDGADHGVRIWNPDGSIAEKSGNGLRIFARWLADRDAGNSFSVWTGFDTVQCTVDDLEVTVEMGRATLEPSEVPVISDEPVIDKILGGPSPGYYAVAVGMGNPHCVLFLDGDDRLRNVDLEKWGPIIENHDAFPNRTNVQFARMERSFIDIRIWERGAGVTSASGSSACAVAVAAVASGRRHHGRMMIHSPGGMLHVAVTKDLDVTLSGPVTMVGTIELDARWVREFAPSWA